MVIGIEVNDHDEDVIGIPQISLLINKSDFFELLKLFPCVLQLFVAQNHENCSSFQPGFGL